MKNRAIINILSVLLCITMLLPLAACTSDEPVQTQLFAMDTMMSLTAYGKNAQAGIDSATGIIKSMDKALDPKSQDSVVSLINRAEGNDVIVPVQVAEMLRTAMSVNYKSKGALDLSIYPIYLAWGEFKEETARIPEADELKELVHNLHFDEASLTRFPGESSYSFKIPAGTQISFGAVAKGCASNYAIEAMKDAGVESGIVSLGGNVQTLGIKPDGSNWTVAVEDPNNPGAYLGTLSVGETAVITSGNYQRYFKGEDGEKYHHIIDPDTGRPVENNLLSVTIICKDGTLADCLSTAMFVLGEKGALQYWRDNGGFEMIMVTDENQVICTSGLIEIFQLTNTDDYTATMLE